MKNYALTIVVSIIAAITSALLIFFRKPLGDVELTKNIAYYLVPFVLAIVLVLKNARRTNVYVPLTIGLLAYGVAFTLLEPIAYKFWLVYPTPSGAWYSRYEMSSLYPAFGLFVLGGVFLVTMALATLAVSIRKIASRVDQRLRRTNQ